MTSKTLSSSSEKYFIQKFTKELIKTWQTLQLDEYSATNETLSYDIFKDFLIKLGFIDVKLLGASQFDHDETYVDKNFVFDIWKHLGGESKNHITLNNLRIFLLSILGIFVEPSINKENQKLFKVTNHGYG